MSSHLPSPPQSMRDDFYVGYLPTPRSHARAILVIIPSLMIVGGLATVLIASLQRDPGRAVWQAEVQSFTGTFIASPVPMLVVQQQDGSQQGMLIVEEGKHGAQQRSKVWDGRAVTIRGRVLTRDQRTIIELINADDAVQPANQPPVNVQRESNLNQAVTLRGEIIDSKCYHGAMKPGDGKGHKACATLCVRNGIPAMLASDDGRGGIVLRLIVGSAGKLDEDTLSKVGEMVEMSGVVSRVAGIEVVTIDPGAVKRVTR